MSDSKSEKNGSPTLKAILQHWTAPLPDEGGHWALPFNLEEFCRENDAKLAQPPTPKASEGADVLRAKLNLALISMLKASEPWTDKTETFDQFLKRQVEKLRSESLPVTATDEDWFLEIQQVFSDLHKAYAEKAGAGFTTEYLMRFWRLVSEFRPRASAQPSQSSDADLKVMKAHLDEARELCALMAEGEGDDATVYMTMARNAMMELDEVRHYADSLKLTVGPLSGEDAKAHADAVKSFFNDENFEDVKKEYWETRRKNVELWKRTVDLEKENAELKAEVERLDHRLQKELDKNAGEVKARNEALARARKAESALESLKGNPK